MPDTQHIQISDMCANTAGTQTAKIYHSGNITFFTDLFLEKRISSWDGPRRGSCREGERLNTVAAHPGSRHLAEGRDV